MRGHKLGRVIYEGKAIANTGVPGIIGGYAAERVIHAPVDGILHNIAKDVYKRQRKHCIPVISVMVRSSYTT